MFYTNVTKHRNNILFRGYDDKGRRIQTDLKLKPYLFIPSKTKTKYKNFNGDYVEKKYFDNTWKAKEFLDKYSGMDRKPIFGYDKYSYVWMYDNLPKDVEYDKSLIKICPFDIEVDSEKGFPDIDVAECPVTVITIGANDGYHVFTAMEYKPSEEAILHKCADEKQLLEEFLYFIQKYDPDVLTGWNCLPIGNNIWKREKICKIKNINKNDILVDSIVKNISPISRKKIYKQILSNGQEILSSSDHKFPYILCNNEKYTKLNFNNKSFEYSKDLSVLDAKKCSHEC